MLHDSSSAGRDDVRMEDHQLFSKIAYAFVLCTAPCDIKEACITCTSTSCHEAQLKLSETREHRFYFTFSLFGFFNIFFRFFVSASVQKRLQQGTSTRIGDSIACFRTSLCYLFFFFALFNLFLLWLNLHLNLELFLSSLLRILH